MPFRPERVGADEIKLVIGRHSGRRAVAHRLHALGVELSDEQVIDVLKAIKQVPKGTTIDDDVLRDLAKAVGQVS